MYYYSIWRSFYSSARNGSETYIWVEIRLNNDNNNNNNNNNDNNNVLKSK